MGIFEKTLTDDILLLIPQRAPFVMVDSFYGIDDNNSYTSLTVKPENICVKDGLLQDFGLIEHIAQSAAARVGYLAQQNRVPIPIGFIGSVENFVLNHFPCVETTLHTCVTVEHKVENITLISAKVWEKHSGKEVCTCKMKIFLNS